MKLFSAEGPVFSGLIKLFDCICLHNLSSVFPSKPDQHI